MSLIYERYACYIFQFVYQASVNSRKLVAVILSGNEKSALYFEEPLKFELELWHPVNVKLCLKVSKNISLGGIE